MRLFLITILLILTACSSQTKEVVRGHDGASLSKARNAIHGKSPESVLKLLGNPAIHGECKTCVNDGLYRIIYLTRDMRRFYLDLAYNTDQNIECVILNFYPYKKTRKYIFDSRTGFRIEKKCNRKKGAILVFKEKLEESSSSQGKSSKSK